MGIYIEGAEMPTMPETLKQGETVPYIDVRIFADGYAVMSKGENPYYTEFSAVSVPPHGRLGDLDALAETHRTMAYENSGRSYSFHTAAKAWVDEAPTVIPAESEDE